jgi:class 3 adenylate cyclase
VIAIGIWSRLNYTKKSKAILQIEKDRSEHLLLNILPEEIADELKAKGFVDAQDFETASILFTDFKSFTETAAKLTPQALVEEINVCFKVFDGIMEKYTIEKIKTIGDAYMAAGGLPKPDSNAIKNTIFAALEMQDFITQHKKDNNALHKPAFEMRVGIHVGPVVAGIVGVKKFQYDIWGDTVNIASRVESNGDIGKVNISQATYEFVKNEPKFSFEHRGKIQAKGKGEMDMYFVSLKPN